MKRRGILFAVIGMLLVVGGFVSVNPAKAAIRPNDTTTFYPALHSYCNGGWTTRSDGWTVSTNGGTHCHDAIWAMPSHSLAGTCTIHTFIPSASNAYSLTFGIFDQNSIQIGRATVNEGANAGRWVTLGTFSKFDHVYVADSTGYTGYTLGVGAMYYIGC